MRLPAGLLALCLGLSLAACGADDPGPGPGGDDDQAAAPDAGTPADPIPFMGECTLGMDDACETGVCFDFNAKGPHCTHACTVDADCEAPSLGCNGMGVCKAPGGGDGSGGGGGGGGA
ncbi:MAG: hypothetical protein H6709_14490 [Kofleriaceae bacterium]|nr:hypothetical protein [Kofleriaceae bacterium]MCB9573286.1 hypothetical protein [Kofleriaceae bacterium]